MKTYEQIKADAKKNGYKKDFFVSFTEEFVDSYLLAKKIMKSGWSGWRKYEQG